MSHHDEGKTPGEAFREAIPPGADAVEPRDPAHRPVPRDRSKVLWYAVPAVLFVLLGLGWMFSSEMRETSPAGDAIGTTGDRGNDPEGGKRVDVLNPTDGPAVISRMELLSDAEDYVGRPARFAAIPVSTTYGDRTFSVGRIGSRALVLAEPGADLSGIRSGDPVSLEGRIERAPSAEELDRLGLGKEDREALDDEDVIIRATRVEPVAQDVGTNQAETPHEGRSTGEVEK